MKSIEIKRLAAGDGQDGIELFAIIAEIFDNDFKDPSPQYVENLLSSDGFWAIEARIDGKIVGGLTAHVLPMIYAEERELFIYDIAVREEFQRKGIGTLLLQELRNLAKAQGIGTIFVAADNEDEHALDFYRKTIGEGSAVTHFTFEVS